MPNKIICNDEYCTMYMTGGHETIFSKRHFEKIKNYRWYVLNQAKNYTLYVRSPDINKYLHRLITDCPKEMVVDHINKNALDNRDENLRITTQAKNRWNSKQKNNNKAGIKGVSKKNDGSYQAWIGLNHRRIYLGYFKDLNNAVMARKEAEKKYHNI